MSSRKTTPAPAGNQLGNLLRHWRNVRGRNQLDLSIETGVSQRHISFIESGRSSPSRQTLLEIAQVLDVPLRERNTLLLSAGYAPVYSEAAWNSVQMQSVTKALERILRQHEPFPALVMDRYWNVLLTNDAAPRFFDCFIDMSRRKGPRNMLHLIFDPDGMRPFVENWADVAASLMRRVKSEATGGVIDEKTKELLAALLMTSEPSVVRITQARIPIRRTSPMSVSIWMMSPTLMGRSKSNINPQTKLLMTVCNPNPTPTGKCSCQNRDLGNSSSASTVLEITVTPHLATGGLQEAKR